MLATLGVSQTSAMASDSKKAKDSAISIFALLDRKSEIDSSSNEGLTLDEVKGNIDFRHVSFNYPTRPDVVIFNNFTLHIPYGKVSLLLVYSSHYYIYYNHVLGVLCLLWSYIDHCTRWREWLWQVNGNRTAGEILQSRFRYHFIGWSGNQELEHQLVEEANWTSEPRACTLQ